jgi:hypothetical protein
MKMGGPKAAEALSRAAVVFAFDFEVPRGRPFSVMGFTLRGGKIVEIDVLADPARLEQLDVAVLDEWRSQRLGYAARRSQRAAAGKEEEHTDDMRNHRDS